MLDIAKKYERQYGSMHAGICAFVEDLMRGDEDTFKAGYTRPNAIIAAAEAFDITRDAIVRHLNVKEQA